MRRRLGPATERQRAILAAVVALTKETGEKPSAIAIADRLGVTRTGIRPQLHSLEAQGLLVDVPKTVSSGKWAVSDEALALLEEEATDAYIRGEK